MDEIRGSITRLVDGKAVGPDHSWEDCPACGEETYHLPSRGCFRCWLGTHPSKKKGASR